MIRTLTNVSIGFLFLVILCEIIPTDTAHSIQADYNRARVEGICLDGRLFILATSNNGVDIEQVYRRFNKLANPPIPVSCKEEKQ